MLKAETNNAEGGDSMRREKNILRKSIAAGLSAVFCFSSLIGCGQTPNNTKIAITDSSSSDEGTAAAEQVSSVNVVKNADLDSEEFAQEKTDESEVNDAAPVVIPTDWESYVGDLDTFVYGILINEYEKNYDVFNACVDLSDGTEVFGIAYTDYGCAFESDDGTLYFPAGFISNIGEPEVPDYAVSEGLEIVNLDLQGMLDEYKYVLAYDTESYQEHCVVWGQYLKYGVGENGSITYSSEEYERGKCDESLGALYSYDSEEYVYDPEVGNAVNVNGVSLYSLIDYDELEAEVNRILEEQDYNFSKSEVESSAYIAQEALNAYLLSKQEETFMGVSVRELLDISKTLDPLECVQFTSDGRIVVEMSETPPAEPDQLVRWLTGACCVTAIAASIAVGIFVPAAVPLSGSISSSAVEVFMEVVIQNQALSDVNWSKVAVAAASGAMLAWCCPALSSAAASGTVKALGETTLSYESMKVLGKLSGYGVLTFSNACVSGTTGAAFTVLDGGTQENAVDAFMMGAALGAASTIAASALSESINQGMKVLATAKPDSWFIKASENVGNFISNHQVHLIKNDEIEAILAPKSVCEATESALNEIDIQERNQKIFDKRIGRLVGDDNTDFVKCDPKTGEILSKSDVVRNNGDCVIKLSDDCSPKVRELFDKYGISEINVKNGTVDFGSIADYRFSPSETITSNRYYNYKVYRKDLANAWKDPSANVPDDVLKYMSDHKISRENLSGSDIKKILSDLKLTPHEGTDGIVYLVDTDIHSLIPHAGGVTQAAVLEKVYLGTVYFRELARAGVVAVSGTLIAEVAEQ